MVNHLKSLQVAVSLVLMILMWLIYPGVMVLFASLIGVCYMIAAIAAYRNNRIAIWIAFVYSTLTAMISLLGVQRFLDNGFDYFVGNFEHLQGIYLPPYLFLLISLMSTLVVILHCLSWRWLIKGVTVDK